jgi:hypothetical protein
MKTDTEPELRYWWWSRLWKRTMRDEEAKRGAAAISPETASRQSSEKEGINSETVQVRR